MIDSIFSIKDDRDFVGLTLSIFRYQYENCSVYREYVDLLRVDPISVNRIEDIPFLPVQLFKNNKIISSLFETEEMIFTSSSTTGMIPSRHYVADLSLYKRSFLNGFTHFYGYPSQYIFLGLLPSYLERDGSSLVYMTEGLMKASGSVEGGFFLHDFQQLEERLKLLKEGKKRTILLGVSFALLDFAKDRSIDYEDLTIIETGGMKGRGEELTRDEIHSRLKECFNTREIHSEYGMAEMLSQAYSKGGGLFETPPWMKILIRDVNIPFKYQNPGERGGINIIDLANIHSCSFLETQDVGKIEKPSTFTVEGRISNSERRGCNMLVE